MSTYRSKAYYLKGAGPEKQTGEYSGPFQGTLHCFLAIKPCSMEDRYALELKRRHAAERPVLPGFDAKAADAAGVGVK